MEIPPYPESRTIELGDKKGLDRLFDLLQPRVSEFTFANLYLFRHAHDYRLTRVGDTLAILARGYGGEPYFLIPPAAGVEDALHLLLEEGLTLYGADDSFRESCLKDESLEVSADRDSFDYLYSRMDMAELPGNRFHKKKNRISYFRRRHEFLIELYGDRHLQGCLEMLSQWSRVREQTDGVSGGPEVDANREALEMAATLGLEGVVVTVEGKVRAFALGERLNGNTSVCHFEKADPFLEGLYQLTDREFNRLMFTDCRYVNKEQDLGIVNLRVAKLSYHPVDLVRKFRARRKCSLR